MPVSHPSRVERLFIAELAGEAERYEDVVSEIKAIINENDGRLTTDERNLLSVAYKNLTNTQRNSWRTIDGFEKHQAARTSGSATRTLVLIRQQRDRIERELTGVCQDIVNLLDKQLVPAANAGEETVFYSKMKGDYYRYLAEFAHKKDRERYAELSLNAYKTAYKHALSTLEPIHPTRLGLALNFSVFYHDVRKSPERACHLAKSAFDDAVMTLDSADTIMEQTLRDALMILQLLRDDLILWSGEMQN
ncbi:14-3-3 protein [Pluteus cervinus]|uniref:14-3-3 protein n=1 Tax=Pluteus cervinus TaxID=181527 RepID=A0ACD3BCY1_9AGAR|nr:14-3-3 protein [Pluteus cervinus]